MVFGLLIALSAVLGLAAGDTPLRVAQIVLLVLGAAVAAAGVIWIFRRRRP